MKETDAGAAVEAESAVAPEDVAIIVAAVDTSPGASLVVDTAARMARRTWPSAQLHMVHIYRTGMFDRAPPGGSKDDDLVAEAKHYLDHHVRMARRQCSAPVTGHFAHGDPADEIVKVATSLRADLVLIGTHDSVGLERLLFGSVAEAVARKARCSVLIVRSPARRG